MPASYTHIIVLRLIRRMEGNDAGGSRLGSIYFCLKYLMIFVNAIIFICGSILIGMGLWIKYGTESFVRTIGSHSACFLHVSLFCVAAGIVMVVLGFLGSYGAYWEKRVLLLIFLLIMLTLFICEVAAAVLVLAFADLAESIVKDKGLQSIRKNYYGSNGHGLVVESWDSIMKKFACCGFFGYEDFINSTFSVKTGLKYPKACCRDPKKSDCNGITTTEQVINKKGCFPTILEAVKKNSMALGIAAAVITGWELFSIIVSVALIAKLG
ncbi:tetraspanin-1-like isoform X2 [Engystomops pustulosus]|uniref:tetraspanin-1-like isoform X2 n=1 Tax=Engystomops pustulosus TaxID=76066 RepID=UPI003AFB340E